MIILDNNHIFYGKISIKRGDYMFIFEKTSPELIEVEESIANSDPYFNMVSKGKEAFTREEILEEMKTSAEVGAERFILKEGTTPVAAIEYLMENKNDQCTWLGLLQVKKEFQGKGYGTRILQQIEELFKSKQVEKYRIGVIAENEPGLRFWQKQGFQKVRSVMNEDQKEVFVFEKAI
jgi:GNAT superfamily N-acetyltransferase